MVGLRFFGHYYLQLVPPLVSAHRGRALAGRPDASRSPRCVFAALFAVAFSAAGYFMRPFGPEPRYQTVSRYLAAHTEPNDRVLVWGSVPEIYWASGALPAEPADHDEHVPRGQPPGAAARGRRARGVRPGGVGLVLPGPRRRTRRATSSTPRPPRSAARSGHRSSASRASQAMLRDAVPLRPHHRRHRHLRRAASRGQPRSHHRPGDGVVAGVGLREAPVAQEVGRARRRSPTSSSGESSAAEPLAERHRRRARATTRQTSSASGGGTGSPAKSQMTVRSFHWRMEREPVVDADDHVVRQSRRQWPPLRSVLLASTSNTANWRKRSSWSLEQREVVLLGVVVDEALHRALTERPVVAHHGDGHDPPAEAARELVRRDLAPAQRAVGEVPERSLAAPRLVHGGDGRPRPRSPRRGTRRSTSTGDDRRARGCPRRGPRRPARASVPAGAPVAGRVHAACRTAGTAAGPASTTAAPRAAIARTCGRVA